MSPHPCEKGERIEWPSVYRTVEGLLSALDEPGVFATVLGRQSVVCRGLAKVWEFGSGGFRLTGLAQEGRDGGGPEGKVDLVI